MTLQLTPAEGRWAVPDGDGLRFDVHLQGDQETPFLAS